MMTLAIRAQASTCGRSWTMPSTIFSGGMIGETTLAMLYVPLLFYLFDRLSERSKAKKEAKPGKRTPAEGSAAQDGPHEQAEDH